MQSITLRSHVGADGILHLDVPVGVHDADFEVTVTLKAVTPKASAKTPVDSGYPPDFFERTAGCFQDEPLVRYSQGELLERNWDDLLTGH